MSDKDQRNPGRRGNCKKYHLGSGNSCTRRAEEILMDVRIAVVGRCRLPRTHTSSGDRGGPMRLSLTPVSTMRLFSMHFGPTG